LSFATSARSKLYDVAGLDEVVDRQREVTERKRLQCGQDSRRVLYGRSNQKVDITGETRMTMEGNGMATDH